MIKLGLIGGISAESTLEYYRLLNEVVRQRLGAGNSAELGLYSFNFKEITELLKQDDWKAIADRVVEEARKLKMCGSDAILICSNTIHKVAEEVEQRVRLPLIHIADATADAIEKQGLSKVGLLGTTFTMEEDFYKGRLADKYSLEVIVPSESDREIVHNIIFDELCEGIVTDESRQQYQRIISDLESQGAQGVILGCTEIGMLIKPEDIEIAVFDTTHLHAKAAIDFALSKERGTGLRL